MNGYSFAHSVSGSGSFSSYGSHVSLSEATPVHYIPGLMPLLARLVFRGHAGGVTKTVIIYNRHSDQYVETQL